MMIPDLINLEKFISYLSKEILQKSNWPDVGKAEWMYVAQAVNEALEKQYKKKGKMFQTYLSGRTTYMST